jgi:hypothetical protein
MLTTKQKRALAREARKMAMECVENGPKMIDSWCGCAIGIALSRAGLLPNDGMEQHFLGCEIEKLVDPTGPYEARFGEKEMKKANQPDALARHQARACVWCEAEPKRKGDHLGAKCRAMLAAKWRQPLEPNEVQQ